MRYARHKLAVCFAGMVASLLLATVPPAFSAHQKTTARPVKLPSADKVIDSYLKAIGGKKPLAAIRDASHEWAVTLDARPMGVAKTQIKTPGSIRSEITFGNGQIVSGANASSAWVRGLDGQLRTLIGDEAKVAKLQALLDASHLVDYKKLNVLARVVSVNELSADPAYVVEFSTRNGARLRYWFSTTSKLLIQIEDDVGKRIRPFPTTAHNHRSQMEFR